MSLGDPEPVPDEKFSPLCEREFLQDNEIEPEPAAVSSVFPADRLPLVRAYVAVLAGDAVVRGLVHGRAPAIATGLAMARPDLRIDLVESL